MSRDTDRQIQTISFHFQQREHLKAIPHMIHNVNKLWPPIAGYK
jgi:hypothetical protein